MKMRQVIAITMIFLCAFAGHAQDVKQSRWTYIEKAKNNQVETSDSIRAYSRHSESRVRVSFGTALMTSEVIQTVNLSERNHFGQELQAEFEHVWKHGLGIGINFAYNGTSYSLTYFHSYYFGPSFVYSPLMGRHWQWLLELGIGYARYHEYGYSQDGFGTNFKAALGYRFNRHWELGLETGSVLEYFQEPSSVKGLKEYPEGNYGLARITLLLGLSYHF